MMEYKLHTTYRQLLADTVTPVSIYLKLRDRFVNTILLESSDYHGNENSFSYICCQPIARFELNGGALLQQFPDGREERRTLSRHREAVEALDAFRRQFRTESDPFPFIHNGLFGYMAYDAVRHFDDLPLRPRETQENRIPEIIYQVFKHVIVINHFKNELYVFEYRYEGAPADEPEGLPYLISLIRNKNFPSYQFRTKGEEASNLTDAAFGEVLAGGQQHCRSGEVRRVVLSRRYAQPFAGDEFNVYRALRSVNPSPYLFYFDFGSFKLFGSSPEAQITIKQNVATIFPVARPFRRTGNDQADAQLAQDLSDDPRENAEHELLVDLARHDLSRHGANVQVEPFREIQFYAHTIHLVSKVTARLDEGMTTAQMVADTFPAGILSGAPKQRAMQLIDRLEPTARGYYGGCIGFMDFNGDFNHAIMIRSFLSKNNVLYYQAGAGVTAGSDVQGELRNVTHKLAALRKALGLAQQME